jgi:predicted acyltransferase
VHRRRSIDALRGLAVAVWIIGTIAVPVLAQFPRNTVCTVISAQFSPSFWKGLTVYDLVLPTFLFVAGASIAPAFQTQLAGGRSQRELYGRIARRVVLLSAIGLVCEGGLFQRWPYIRIVGAFQRIAICYAIVALLQLKTGWRLQAAVLLVLLLDYWVILRFGRNEPSVDAYSAENNAAAYVDNLLLPGRKDFGTWDSQGILTTIPAVSIMIAGLLAFKVLLGDGADFRRRTAWVMGAGVAAIGEGLLWDDFCPIEPHLWTPTFCIVAIGFSVTLFGVFHILHDIRGWRMGVTVVTALGRNALPIILAAVLFTTVVSTTTFASLGYRFVPIVTSAGWATVELYVLVWLALMLERRDLSLTV